MTDRDRQIVKLYRAGLALRVIGEKFGLTREGARQIVKRSGEPLKGLKERGGSAAKPPSDTELKIAAAHARGLYPSDIADELGVNKREVQNAIQRLGLKPHGSGKKYDTPERRETDAKIVAAYLAGKPQSQIIREVPEAKNPPRVYRALRRAGIGPMRKELYSRFERCAE